MKRRIIIVAFVSVLLAVSASVGYYLYEQQQPKQVKIMFAGVVLSVELATTPEEQEMGLSNRTSMPADHGMLFIFNQEAQWSFWMHQMNFPLDIIWFNATRQVVFIEQDLPPCTPQACPIFTPPVNATYVLEVNAGFVKTNGILIGESFTFV
ncbi:MAG TPA: DUF192 domain-containing protein [Candidatus Acidoferrales bacterium]|nr:DUF192 domain-containing protein [Candidatus Acidoferrales bacterium]